MVQRWSARPVLQMNRDVPGYEDDEDAWRDKLRKQNAYEQKPGWFKASSLGDFAGKAVPDRDWLIPSVLIRKSITLFGGDGGVGKSLACMQLQVAAALARPWLGINIQRPVSSFGFYCEDDIDEIHRRFAVICEHYGADMDEIGDSVRFACRVGEAENELVTFRGKSEYGKAEITQTYKDLEQEIRDWSTELVILDTASDVFAGNENIRYQVKSFITKIRALALINNGGVVITAHPSKSAMIDGSGFSGSTAWNGAVRNRLYLSTPKKPMGDEDDGPTDERVLKVMKSNYGPFGEKIRCKWQAGVFIEQREGPGSLIDKLDADHRILKAVEYIISNGGRVAANTSAKNSLAASVRNLPSCRDMSFKMVCNAQDRLTGNGKLVKVGVGPPTRHFVLLRPAHMHYPDEKGEE